PEKSTFESRRRDRCKAENDKFNPDHYIADFMGVQDIKHLLKYKTEWTKKLKRAQQNDTNGTNNTEVNSMNLKGDSEKIEQLGAIRHPNTIGLSEVEDIRLTTENHKNNINDAEDILKFTEKEKSMMLNLPNKDYILQDVKSIYFGLADLLFAYSYNHRVCEGETTVESAWTIGKISPTISCLERFTTLRETIISLFRRSLAYPCYRNFELSQKCLEDVYVLMKLGRRAILKVLLEMKDIFDHSDVYYIYSKIWLDDYCIWCQTKASDKVIRSLAHQLHHYKVSKSDIGWHLEEYEQLALEDQTMG
ncbi:8483_t:CDS:2, partial [Acaulospora morrowiae]